MFITGSHEPCNQSGRGGEKTNNNHRYSRSAMQLWTGPLPSPPIITSKTSHTQNSFHVTPTVSLLSVGLWRNHIGAQVTPSYSANVIFPPLLFWTLGSLKPRQHKVHVAHRNLWNTLCLKLHWFHYDLIWNFGGNFERSRVCWVLRAKRLKKPVFIFIFDEQKI